MKPAPMWDDRTPMMLITFDGLGDRPSPQLSNQTPLAAAHTPILDELTKVGVSGIHQPFGLGRATSSERSHWAMFGQTAPFPGRAFLEALGSQIFIAKGSAHFHLSLRPAQFRDTNLHALGRVSASDKEDCDLLFEELRNMAHPLAPILHPLRTGECILEAPKLSTHEISDSDPLFGHLHPILLPMALSTAKDFKAAQESAELLTSWIRAAVSVLNSHPINQSRLASGKPALIAPVTKWASLSQNMETFQEVTGVSGAAVTSSALYRGLADVLNMPKVHIPSDLTDVQGDFEARLNAGIKLTDEYSFVHVHTKASDEAGHTKDPELKRDVIEALDRACEDLLNLYSSVTITITGDHATPTSGGMMHSAHPTSLIMVGPHVSPDKSFSCSEQNHETGQLGNVQASDILPLLAHYSHRASFIGHNIGPRRTIALPDNPQPLNFFTN
jgi:2,3-bisphosphoglycerate-independent phosphoglycerate mutase